MHDVQFEGMRVGSRVHSAVGESFRSAPGLREAALGFFAVMAVLSTTACVPGAGRAGTSPPTVAVTAPAGVLLDWDAATITLPLDAFGMPTAEIRTVRAAWSIEFARCVTGTRQVSRAVTEEAARVLGPFTPDPDAIHWLYGVWNAEFIAAHGWRPFPQENTDPELVQTDPATAERCFSSGEVLELQGVSTSIGDDGPSKVLALAAADSHTRTLATDEYRGLMDEVETCIVKAGYRAEGDSDLVQIDFASDASEEELLVGMVANARCNDQLNVTQQAADLEAALQRTFIEENQAELLAVKAAADQRVTTAREVLRSVGLG